MDWEALKPSVIGVCKSGGFIGKRTDLPWEASKPRGTEESAEAIVFRRNREKG